MARKEQELSKTAIIQALRFVLGLRPIDIATLLNVAVEEASRVTTSVRYKGIRWEDRRYQSVTVEYAKRLVDGTIDPHQCEYCHRPISGWFMCFDCRWERNYNRNISRLRERRKRERTLK